MKRIVIFASCLVFIFSGCQDKASRDSSSKKLSLSDQNHQLKKQLANISTENEHLRNRIALLTETAPGARLESLYKIERLKIGSYTNLYDSDKDGNFEKLKVYLEPTDSRGDAIKTAADVTVELWDLGRVSDEALIGSWQVTSQELGNMWFSVMMKTNYRLVLDLPESISEYASPLTIKVIFKDFVTGRIFNQQKIIKPLTR